MQKNNAPLLDQCCHGMSRYAWVSRVYIPSAVGRRRREGDNMLINVFLELQIVTKYYY